MQHYQLGQQIGDFTISFYSDETGYYTLNCKCGNTTTGDSTHVTRKVANLMADGFTACASCYYKYKKILQQQKEEAAQVYTFKDVYREYVKKSKARDIHFTLDLTEASLLFTQNCHYCGNPPSNARTRDTGVTVVYQGIDRVDNNKGYESGNVVPCCKHCNSFKSTRTTEEFLNHVGQIYMNRVQRLSREGVEPSGSKQETTTSVVEDIV